MNSEWPADAIEHVTQSACGLAGELQALRPALEKAMRAGIPVHVVLSQGTPLLAAVQGLLDELDAIRRRMAPVVAKLNAPPPPIDAARLESGMEAIRQGDFRVYSDADDMARDVAGG